MIKMDFPFPIRKPVKPIKKEIKEIEFSNTRISDHSYDRKGRLSTAEILQKLKAQEDKHIVKLESFVSLEAQQKKKTVTSSSSSSSSSSAQEKATSKLPIETEIEHIMNEMDRLDHKVKHGDSYLNLYYDMKRMEEKFWKFVGEIEKSNVDISDPVLRRINAKKKYLKNKGK